MSSIVIALALALTVALAIIIGARLKRGSWELVIAAMLVAVGGVIWQGSGGQPGAPRAASEGDARFDEQMVKRRQALGARFGPEGSYLTMADGFSRRGKTAQAVDTINAGLKQYPQSVTLWVALGNALVAHSDGQLTPAADYAFERAGALEPQAPVLLYFRGLALAQSGQFEGAKAQWQALLPLLKPDAELHGELTENIALLDRLMAGQGG